MMAVSIDESKVSDRKLFRANPQMTTAKNIGFSTLSFIITFVPEPTLLFGEPPNQMNS